MTTNVSNVTTNQAGTFVSNTTTLALDEQTQKVLWITGETILIIIILFTVYVFFSLLYYTWRRRNAVGVSGNAMESRERFLKNSCGVAIFMAIVRCALHQAVVFIRNDDVYTCRKLLAASKFFYNATVCLMYVYFWLRQRHFYSYAELLMLKTKLKEIADWIILVLIVSVSGGVAIFAYIPSIGGNHQYYDVNRCDMWEYTYVHLVYIYAALMSAVELALVGLYVHAFLHIRWQFKSHEVNPGKVSISTSKALYPNIQRSLIMLVICIISDAVSATLVSRLTKYFPFLFVSLIALSDINLVIKVTCAICTFRNWRKIIFGFPFVRRFVDTREVITTSNTRANINNKAFLPEVVSDSTQVMEMND